MSLIQTILKMNTLIVLVIIAMCAAAINGQKYTDRYDTINLDEVLDNRRLMVAYIKCMLDQGRCTAEGKELKSHITEALSNGCKKCTPAQRSGSRRVIAHLIKNEPEYWQLLVDKYDPKRVFTHMYENVLNSL